MTIELLYGLLPEFLLLALLVLLLFIEIVGRGCQAARLLFIVTSTLAVGTLLRQLGLEYSSVLLAGEIAVDDFSLMARLVVLGCGLIYGVSVTSDTVSTKFWMLLSSSLLGASVMAVSHGFISLFMGIELLSLPAFALMIHRFRSTGAIEGSFKYLLLSAVASAMILFGISFAYGDTETLVIADAAANLSDGGKLALASGIILLSGFFMKMAVFPFHGWAPDAYSGARLQVTMLLASVVKIAVALGLVRVLGNVTLPGMMVAAVMLFAIASIVYGNVAAIRQTIFRRLLAYSSIAHAGYMVFALADNTGSRVDALLYYLAVYAVTTIVACTSWSMLVSSDNDNLENIDGAFVRRPFPALLLAISALSLAGIPPFPGFLAKLFVFKAVVASGYLVPAVIAFVGSFIGVTYYLGIVVRLFKPVSSTVESKDEGWSAWALGGLVLGLLSLIVMTLAPGQILS